jgi:hypothetical protein
LPGEWLILEMPVDFLGRFNVGHFIIVFIL